MDKVKRTLGKGTVYEIDGILPPCQGTGNGQENEQKMYQ